MIYDVYEQMVAEGYSDPLKCRNKCVIASIRVLELLNIPPDKHHLYMRHGEVHGEEHHWINMYGINYDFTARQYAKNAPFPLIWRGDKHLYANDKSANCVYCGQTLYTNLPIESCAIMHLECIMESTKHLRLK